MSDTMGTEFKGLDLIGSKFWIRVLTTWLKYNHIKADNPRSLPSINEPIFNNSFITFKNKVLFNQKCIYSNMIFIKDFLSQGKIIPFTDFNAALNNAADSLLVYNIIFNALKKFEVHFQIEFENGVGSDIPPCRFCDFETGGVHRRIFYEELKCKITESVLEVWQNKYFLKPNDPEIWSLARECCSETKLLELQ